MIPPPYRGDGRNLLESTHRLVPPEARDLLPVIRWEIVDSNVLLKNIRKDVELYPGATAMRLLLIAGALRLFAGPHVKQEVNGKIEGWMAARVADPTAARLIWETYYGR